MSSARIGAWLVLLIGAWSMATNVAAQTSAFTFDAAASSARFVVHLRLPMRAEGELTRVTGQLLGSTASGWQVQVKVDGSSLRFDGPRWMDKITRSEAFLAVDKFPNISFDSAQFSNAMLRTGGPLRGELTLRGLTRPVSFQLLPSPCAHPGRKCDIQVEGTISRHAFGMNAHRSLVRDDVDFHFRVRLQPESPTP